MEPKVFVLLTLNSNLVECVWLLAPRVHSITLSALSVHLKIHHVTAEEANIDAEDVCLKSCLFLGMSWLCLSLCRS